MRLDNIPALYTRAEAAEAVKIGRTTVYELVARHSIGFATVGGTPLLTADDLKRLKSLAGDVGRPKKKNRRGNRNGERPMAGDSKLRVPATADEWNSLSIGDQTRLYEASSKRDRLLRRIIMEVFGGYGEAAAESPLIHLATLGPEGITLRPDLASVVFFDPYPSVNRIIGDWRSDYPGTETLDAAAMFLHWARKRCREARSGEAGWPHDWEIDALRLVDSRFEIMGEKQDG